MVQNSLGLDSTWLQLYIDYLFNVATCFNTNAAHLVEYVEKCVYELPSLVKRKRRVHCWNSGDARSYVVEMVDNSLRLGLPLITVVHRADCAVASHDLRLRNFNWNLVSLINPLSTTGNRTNSNIHERRPKEIPCRKTQNKPWKSSMQTWSELELNMISFSPSLPELPPGREETVMDRNGR